MVRIQTVLRRQGDSKSRVVHAVSEGGCHTSMRIVLCTSNTPSEAASPFGLPDKEGCKTDECRVKCASIRMKVFGSVAVVLRQRAWDSDVPGRNRILILALGPDNA